MSQNVPNFDSGLTPEQEEAARLLAYGADSVAIAKGLNVCKRTVDRWRKMPAFVAFVRSLREAVRQEASGVLHAAYKAAMRRVTQLTTSGDERIALSAARLHHDMQRDLLTVEELKEELEELKEALKSLAQKVGQP